MWSGHAYAPLIAGVYALADNAAAVSPGYEYAHRQALFDITAGTNDLLGNGAACEPVTLLTGDHDQAPAIDCAAQSFIPNIIL